MPKVSLQHGSQDLPTHAISIGTWEILTLSTLGSLKGGPSHIAGTQFLQRTKVALQRKGNFIHVLADLYF